MAVVLTAPEAFSRKGVRGIQIAFRDTDLTAVTPTAIYWTLTNDPPPDIVPTVINSRDRVAVTPASTVVITLSGDDLDFLTNEAGDKDVDRVLMVEWTYNSSTLGTGVTDYFEYEFKIQNISHFTT